MARIRTIKPTFWGDEKVAELWPDEQCPGCKARRQQRKTSA